MSSNGPGDGDEPPPGPYDRDERSQERSGRTRRRRSRSWSRSPERRRYRSRSRSPPGRRYRDRSFSPPPSPGGRRGGSAGGGYREERYRGPPPPRDFPPMRYGYPPDDGRYRDGPYRDHGPPYPPPPHHFHPPPPYGDPYYGRGPPPPPRGRGGDRRRRDEGPPGVSLLIRNVSSEITTQDLRDAFGRIGELRDVYIPKDYHSQQPKGFAFVEFATAEMAREARDEMDRFVVKGRELEVVFAQERRKTPVEMRSRVVNSHNREPARRERSESWDRQKESQRESEGADKET